MKHVPNVYSDRILSIVKGWRRKAHYDAYERPDSAAMSRSFRCISNLSLPQNYRIRRGNRMITQALKYDQNNDVFLSAYNQGRIRKSDKMSTIDCLPPHGQESMRPNIYEPTKSNKPSETDK